MPSSHETLFEALDSVINEANLPPSEDLSLRVALLMAVLERIVASPQTFPGSKATLARSAEILKDALPLALVALVDAAPDPHH